ncbi:arf-GAP domain and FG repeat-containing protein 1a isoform X2 [Stigmatopora argus]
MAASAKRKQEEKHLKMLREMTSLPANRKCFDCDQRGPTYANMTVGSFVCTSCSGLLRGLNPPHRVKSISMTTFSHQEIEFLQTHGNELCHQTWLGLHDDKTSTAPDFRESQKLKEFLQEKYEKKRWYVRSDQTKPVSSVHASISGSSNSSTSSTPEVRPLKSLLGDSALTLHLSKNTPSNQSPVISHGQTQQQHDKKFDLLSDLGGDIFAATPKITAGPSSGFANFANFNNHTRGAVSSGISSVSGVSHNQQILAKGGDRYAALAELDTVFGPPAPSSGVYNNNNRSTQGVSLSSEKGASTTQAQQLVPAMSQTFVAPQSNNPFVAAGVTTAPSNPFQNSKAGPVAAAAAAAVSFGTASMSMPSGFDNGAAYNFPTSFSGTFQQPFPGQVPYSQPTAYPQQLNGGGGFPGFGQGKPMVTPFGHTMTGPMVSNNPFLGAGPTAQFPGGSSTNPFL